MVRWPMLLMVGLLGCHGGLRLDRGAAVDEPVLDALAVPIPAETVARAVETARIRLGLGRLRRSAPTLPGYYVTDAPTLRGYVVPSLTSLGRGTGWSSPWDTTVGLCFPQSSVFLVTSLEPSGLAHEAGHWLAWWRLGVPGDSAQSERLARKAEGHWLWWAGPWAWGPVQLG